MKHGRIEIKKEKVGEWHPRTKYWAIVDGKAIGRYDTNKDALRAAEEGLKYNDEQQKAVDEEMQDMLNTNDETDEECHSEEKG